MNNEVEELNEKCGYICNVLLVVCIKKCFVLRIANSAIC